MRTLDATVTLTVFFQFNLLFKSTKCFQLVVATILSKIRMLLALKDRWGVTFSSKHTSLEKFSLSFLSRDLESLSFKDLN